LSFYNKNILRWISRSSYQEKIERNIAALEKVTLETNSFLGMLCSNEDLLLKSQTEQDFKDNDLVYDYGVSYTHSLNTKFNISYILEFSPNKITNNYSGTQGSISKKDEIDNLKKFNLQLGYLATPEWQIGFKAGLVKADAKYTLNNYNTDLSGNDVSSSSENHNLTGKSFGINAKKKLNENLFLNFDYSIVSFDKNDLNFNSRLFTTDAPNKREHKIDFFTVGISYKFN
jgi:hypothetical protein